MTTASSWTDLHTIPDDRAGFGPASLAQRLHGHLRHDDGQVEPIAQRAGHARGIGADLRRGATARLPVRARISAGTGIHRGDQHEPAGKYDVRGGAGNRDAPVLDGLPQRVQHAPFELG